MMEQSEWMKECNTNIKGNEQKYGMKIYNQLKKLWNESIEWMHRMN